MLLPVLVMVEEDTVARLRHDRPISRDTLSLNVETASKSSGTFDPGCSRSEPQVKNRAVMR
jgi:hypothetical protein